MTDSVAVDTNLVIAFFASEPGVVARFEALEHLVLPAIVAGELYFGALNSARAEENVARLIRLFRRTSIGFCDRGTAEEYGRIRVELARKGQPLPDNDVWIAAIARQHGLTLATRDAHFGNIERLKLERW
jgi:tRNA(fMet)-specific endonuclease VapC